MLKKTISYTDYNGTERTEDFWFNLSEADIMEMELSTSGGFVEMIDRVVAAQDTVTLVKLFKEIIMKAYGVKSPDGRRFIKTKEISDEFSQTEAYSKLFMELVMDDKAAADFVNGITPSSAKPSIPAPPVAN